MNLDNAIFDDLQLLIGGMTEQPTQYALQLFPEQPTGYVETAKLIALYATELLEARRYRAQGHVQDAIALEKKCQKIYNDLPEYARW